MGIQEHGVVLGFGEIPPGKTSRESPSLERFGLDFGKIPTGKTSRESPYLERFGLDSEENSF